MAMTRPKSSQVEHRGDTVQKVIDDITQEDGVLSADPSWTDVPKLRGANANKQAQALANRTEFLAENASIKMQGYDALRAYSGKVQAVDITSYGIAGRFYCKGVVTGASDDGGVNIIDAGGRLWVRRYSGPISAGWFDIDPTRATDSTPGFRRWISYLAKLCAAGEFWQANIPFGKFTVTDTLDFSALTNSGATVLSSTRWEIKGAGQFGTLIYVSDFGGAKEVFIFPEETNYFFGELSVYGPITGANSKTPRFSTNARSSQGNLGNLFVSGLGGGIYGSRFYNADWGRIELASIGYQPIKKSVPTSVGATYTAGGVTVSTNADVFDESDVGCLIGVDGTSTANRGYVRKIVSVTDARNVTVDEPFMSAGSNCVMTFYGPLASLTNGSTSVVFNFDCLSDDDIGRLIFFSEGNSSSGAFAAKIVSITNAKTAVIDKAAGKTISGVGAYFSASFYGGYYFDVAGTPINDICINQMRIEAYRGAGVVLERGTSVFFNNLKTHGIPEESGDYGRCGPAWIQGNTSGAEVNGWLMEMTGADGFAKSNIVVNGANPSLYARVYATTARAYDALATLEITDDAGAISVHGNSRITPNVFLKSQVWSNSELGRSRIISQGFLASRGGDYSNMQANTPQGSALLCPPLELGIDIVRRIPVMSHKPLMTISASVTADAQAAFFFNSDTGAITSVQAGSKVTLGSNVSGTLCVQSEVNATTGKYQLLITNRLGVRQFISVGSVG